MHSPQRKNHLVASHRAFTLTELLVVIVIIAALAALSFQVTRTMKASANSVKTIGNLRSLGSLMNLYANDNNNFFPWADNPGIGGAKGSWKYQILEYGGLLDGLDAGNTNQPVGGRAILETPSAPKPILLKESNAYLATGFSAAVGVLGQVGGPDGNGYVRRLSRLKIDKPSQCALIFTGAQASWPWDGSASTIIYSPWCSNYTEAENPSKVLPSNYKNGSHGQVGFFVKGGAAMVMVDGSVEIVKKSDFSWRYLQTGNLFW